jgi:hypothetical protein
MHPVSALSRYCASPSQDGFNPLKEHGGWEEAVHGTFESSIDTQNGHR